MQQKKIIVSDAHEWYGGSPPHKETLTCRRCGKQTVCGKWDGSRCVPHYESESSGFEDVGNLYPELKSAIREQQG